MSEFIILANASPTPITDFDFIHFLNLMSRSLKFTVEYTDAPSMYPGSPPQAKVNLIRDPLMNFYGVGENMLDAQNDAARMAVEYLQFEARYVSYFDC